MTSNTARLRFLTRAFSIVAAYKVLMDFISPAMWVLTTPESLTSKVAYLSTSGTALGVIFLLAGVLVMPFVVMQFVDPDNKHRTAVIKICNAGNICGAFIWFFMAFLARNLDYPFIVFNFLFNGVGALGLAALLANSINNDQIESALTRKKAVP